MGATGGKPPVETIYCLTNKAPIGNFCATKPIDECTSYISQSEAK
jgi:hypothetical protein